MKHQSFLPAAILGSLLCLSGQAKAQLSCEADLAPFFPEKHRVDLKPLANGQFEVRLNHQLQPEPAQFLTETVRDDLHFAVDLNDADIASYNPAERSLLHIYQLQQSAVIKDNFKLDIPFDLRQVKTLKTMNLTGKMNKFGGTVLLEAYGADQQLLGRVFRKLFIGACR